MLDKILGEVDLLERHLSVMRAVSSQGPIGIMKLTEGRPHRSAEWVYPDKGRRHRVR